MYTATEVDEIRDRMKAAGASKAEIIQAISAYALGWPYVFGAWGCLCTPTNRRTYAARCESKKPEYAKRIREACPVLSGKAANCDLCDWNGVRCFDCRGFTHWLLEQVSLQLYGDTVSTQWETKSNWVLQGNIADIPKGLVCCIFRKGHTGMYLGGGITRHCSTIVKEEPMPGKPNWLQFGIPAGLYTDEELRKAGITVSENSNIPTIRKGAKGDLVKQLQQALIDEGFGVYLGTVDPVDGIYGAKTVEAVKAFQKANGLSTDGICGPKTWASLGITFEKEPADPIPSGDHDGDIISVPSGEASSVAVPISWLRNLADFMEKTAKEIRNYGI